MTEFKYNGYKFKMDKWNVSSFSDATKGYVQVDTDLGWIDIIEYKGFELDEKITLLDDEVISKSFTEDDNFYFDEENIIAFISNNESRVMELIKKEEAGA